MGNAQGIEGGVFMSTGSLREGSFTCADRLPGRGAEPRLSPNVCRDARSQQSDPSPSPEGTDPTLRNTSGEEQRKLSSPESQGTRLVSGTYTESAVEAAEVRGDARAQGHVT